MRSLCGEDFGHVLICFLNPQRTEQNSQVLKALFTEHLLCARCCSRLFKGIDPLQASSGPGGAPPLPHFTDAAREAWSYPTRSRPAIEGTVQGHPVIEAEQPINDPNTHHTDQNHELRISDSAGTATLKTVPPSPLRAAHGAPCSPGPILTRSPDRADNRGHRRMAASSRRTPWEGKTPDSALSQRLKATRCSLVAVKAQWSVWGSPSTTQVWLTSEDKASSLCRHYSPTQAFPPGWDGS